MRQIEHLNKGRKNSHHKIIIKNEKMDEIGDHLMKLVWSNLNNDETNEGHSKV